MSETKKTWIQVTRDTLIPMTEPDVRKELDKRNILSIRLLSGVLFVAQVLVLLFFILTQGIKEDTMRVVWNVAFCVLFCGSSFGVSFLVERLKRHNHFWVTLYIYAASAAMSAFAILVDLQHYREGQQTMTLVTVVIALVVFVTVHPIGGILSNLTVFGGLYVLVWLTDGAKMIHVYDYVLLALVCAICSVFRYSQRIIRIRKTLDMEAANEQLQKVHRHDVTTGCRNRTALAEDYASYYGRPLAVIMSDIDYFKQFNDKYGHQAGDDVLRQTAVFMVNHFRIGSVYRYGGDEFLIFLPETDDGTVRELCGEQNGFEIPVTAVNVIGTDEVPKSARLSFGIAFGEAADEAELNALVADADRELYLVKRELHRND